MAKLVDVSYGSSGNPKKKLYTYVVNDNVQMGQFLNVAVTHRDSGKTYGTLAIAQKDYPKGTSLEQRKIEDLENTLKVEVGEDGYAKLVKGVTPKRVYSAEQAGLPTAGRFGRDEKGRFVSMTGKLGFEAVENKQTGRYQAKEGKKYQWNTYMEAIRQYNVEQNKNPQQTFDEYSKNFLNRGE